MSDSVEPVESKRCRQQCFSGVFKSFRETVNEFDNVCAVEGARGNKVG